ATSVDELPFCGPACTRLHGPCKEVHALTWPPDAPTTERFSEAEASRSPAWRTGQSGDQYEPVGSPLILK
ncbi:MAG: hypothetical protein ACRENE_22705, partial [Polyangiaceae bacterium]